MELLERDRELEAIEALLERGGVLVVEGGTGIGKTSLLGAARRRAGRLGSEVVRARPPATRPSRSSTASTGSPPTSRAAASP